MLHKRQKITGWGRFPVVDTDAFRPDRRESLTTALQARDSVIAHGVGRSYGDAALNSAGATLLMERINRLLEFDKETGMLHAEAGTTLSEIAEIFVPKGFFLPVTPGTRFVTLGGAVASDVHGKGHHLLGSFANHVVNLTLLLADGSVTVCSREQNPDLFWATVGGQGLTGIITEVRLKLRRIESAFIGVRTERASNLDEALQLFDEGDEEFTYSVAWIDCLATGRSLGRSVLMRGNWMKAAELPRKYASEPLRHPPVRHLSVPIEFPGFVLNSLSVRAFNFAYFNRAPRQAREICTGYVPFFFPLDAVNNWNRIYGRRGFLQWQFVIPFEDGIAGMTKILERLAKSGAASFLAVLKKFGKSDPNQMLSFPSPGYMLALDFPFTGRLLGLLDELDKIVLDCGGRFYLTKDARMKPETFRAGYPRLPEWLEIKRRIDPQNRFSSDQARRLGMVPGPVEKR
jgi:decaprenylphospho-beta-D-ribofuranose 2-oxidase